MQDMRSGVIHVFVLDMRRLGSFDQERVDTLFFNEYTMKANKGVYGKS